LPEGRETRGEAEQMKRIKKYRLLVVKQVTRMESTA